MASIAVESDVDGMVWKVLLTPGTPVEAGQTILIIESMKMEIPVDAPQPGTVTEILVAPEETVAEQQVVAVITT